MNTGTKIAIGAGAFLLLSRQKAAASTASSPVAAASNGLSSLEKSLLSLLTPKPSSPPKSSGGSGGNPAGGAGSGRSAGGNTPTMPVENAFDVFPNFNGPNVIDVGPTGAAFEPGGIFSDPSSFAGNEAPDASFAPQDQAPETSLIDSLAQESSGVPVFDPGSAEDVPIDDSFFD
jgi:hypothetical protein